MNKKTIKFTIFLAFWVFISSMFIDFVKYPECYISTWKCQLETDLKNNDGAAMAYYENTYKKNNRDLFKDNFAIVKKNDESGELNG